jgi:hypothetical protein
MAAKIDIPALIATDARVYLKNSEQFLFIDGVASNTGPFMLGTDYMLGDVIGIQDELSGKMSPAKVVEIVMTLEPGSEKIIPTFSVYTEKDPTE